MLTWFLLAFGAAITNSFTQVNSKWAVTMSRYAKPTILFIGFSVATLIMAIAVRVVGVPEIAPDFWWAALGSAGLNFIAFPILLKAYEIGEFSSVYSMILLTPIFLMLTAFVGLGEVPTLAGGIGVLLTVLGLYVVNKSHTASLGVKDYGKGNLLGITVALIYSVSVNFDKLAAQYSSPFFAGLVYSMLFVVAYGLYSLIKYRTFFVRESGTKQDLVLDEPGAKRGAHPFYLPGFFIIMLLGLTLAAGSLLHNAALLTGYASYTIAVKRIGVLFGVVWGWLFFHEKDLGRKFLGAAIAVGGVILLVLFG